MIVHTDQEAVCVVGVIVGAGEAMDIGRHGNQDVGWLGFLDENFGAAGPGAA